MADSSAFTAQAKKQRAIAKEVNAKAVASS